MTRYHFHIHEDGRIIRDDEGLELEGGAQVRQEALATGASIAKEAFIAGSACQVVVDVQEDDDIPFLKVSISISVEEV
jgi:uncharacterized protein DUF6894